MVPRVRIAVVLALVLAFGIPAAAQGAAVRSRPVASSLTVWPRKPTSGQEPSISLKIVQRGVHKVRARIVVLAEPSKAPVGRLDLGRIATGRRLTVPWPAGTSLQAGSYLVRVHALDPHGRTLLRHAKTSGRLMVSVQSPPATPAGGLLPGVFPVAGPHTMAAPGSAGSFGAGRPGHIHEGEDIPAASGTPVVAPVAGTVSSVSYQAGGAGWYVVLDGADGRDYFFAHCTAGSVAVAAKTPVSPGTPLCGVGMTGDATGPHLHFEIWMVGWRVPGGYPVDPVPQLRAWGG